MTAAEAIEARVRAVLDGLGVPYEWLECDPDYADTAVFCERYGHPPEKSGNTILVASKRGEKRYAACVVQATAQLDVNHAVRDLMGVKRLSFASAEETAEVTGMLIGGVTPFDLPPEVPLYVDGPIMDLDYVILGAGSRSAKVRVSPAVFERLPGARVVPGLSRATGGAQAEPGR